jgi:hypothetical protein
VGSRWSSALQLKSASPDLSASASGGEKVLTSLDIDFFDVVVEYPAAGSVFSLDIVLRQVSLLGSIDEEHGCVVVGQLELYYQHYPK